MNETRLESLIFDVDRGSVCVRWHKLIDVYARYAG